MLDHPRRLWLRKALFQVHLWAGLLLSLYVVVIALTGSVLVFEDELTATTLPAGLRALEPGRTAPVEAVAGRFAAEFPGWTLESVTVPTRVVPAFQLQAEDGAKHAVRMAGDPQTGELRVMPRSWVEVVHDLHVYLLLPRSYGAQVNGVGAAVLLLLTVTGLVLWWPGRRVWTRGLRVNLRASWRRINYDVHSAVGFWTLLIVFWWSVSGVYFGFYKQVAAAVNAVAPLKNMRAPVPLVATTVGEPKRLGELLRVAQEVSPRGRLYSVSDPLVKGPSVYFSMDLRELGDFGHRDLVMVDARSGKVLSLWRYGVRESVGDWVMWSMHPLHFGTLWGMAVKVVWAAVGVGLAVLSVTGVVMYWNRFLGKRWRAMVERPE